MKRKPPFPGVSTKPDRHGKLRNRLRRRINGRRVYTYLPGVYRGGRLYYRRGKTGQEVDLPILTDPTRELSQLPRSQMMLLARGDHGKGYSPVSLGNWFRDRCREVGLNHCSSHGLRKAGARRLAEHSATEGEVMAFLAHETAKEASRYVAAANRTKLTTSGMARLEPKQEKHVSNLGERLDNAAR